MNSTTLDRHALAELAGAVRAVARDADAANRAHNDIGVRLAREPHAFPAEYEQSSLYRADVAECRMRPRMAVAQVEQLVGVLGRDLPEALRRGLITFCHNAKSAMGADVVSEDDRLPADALAKEASLLADMIMAEAPPLIPDDTDDLRAWLVEHGVDRRRGDGTLRAGYQSLHDAITAGETAISGRSHRQAITGAQDDLDAMHPRWGQRFEVVAAHGEEPAKLRYKPPGT